MKGLIGWLGGLSREGNMVPFVVAVFAGHEDDLLDPVEWQLAPHFKNRVSQSLDFETRVRATLAAPEENHQFIPFLAGVCSHSCPQP